MNNPFRKIWFQSLLLIVLAGAVLYALFQQEATKESGAMPGGRAPSFELEDVQGGKLRLADYEGKGLALNFWASWCNPCVNELPLLNEAYKLAGFEMIAINVGEDAEAAQKFVDRYELAFPIALDKEQQVKKRYRVVGLPLTVLIDPQGAVIERHEGELKDMADILRLMERLKDE
ncbi:redoxin domain-containing protein [Paenibacillus arenilitoris]|uniref:redoxin domain-containing protein n=1 Tax=Paenibacillus arenilitoris TaxID=2772299 RepID=UPI001CC2410B|nr:redoxin domain-containing protein [Paenibacillus arenilitoris]